MGKLDHIILISPSTRILRSASWCQKVPPASLKANKSRLIKYYINRLRSGQGKLIFLAPEWIRLSDIAIIGVILTLHSLSLTIWNWTSFISVITDNRASAGFKADELVRSIAFLLTNIKFWHRHWLYLEDHAIGCRSDPLWLTILLDRHSRMIN